MSNKKVTVPAAPVSESILGSIATYSAALLKEVGAIENTSEARTALVVALAEEFGPTWYDADKKSDVAKAVEAARQEFLTLVTGKLVLKYRAWGRYDATVPEKGPSEREGKARGTAYAYWGKVKDAAAAAAGAERERQANGARPKSEATVTDEAKKAAAELPLHVRLLEGVKPLAEAARKGGLTEAADALDAACKALAIVASDNRAAM